MNGIEAVSALGPAGPAWPAAPGTVAANILPEKAAGADFQSLLANGIASLDGKLARADALVARFAVDDSVPVHQVTIAIEEARLSLEFAMQVRARFVEGFKELMNMQL